MSFILRKKGIFAKEYEWWWEKEKWRGNNENGGDEVFYNGTNFLKGVSDWVDQFCLSMIVKTASPYPYATLTFFLHLPGCIWACKPLFIFLLKHQTN